MTVHHGARIDLISPDVRSQCAAFSPFPREANGKIRPSRCVYVTGHNGMHYADWIAWTDDQPQPPVAVQS